MNLNYLKLTLCTFTIALLSHILPARSQVQIPREGNSVFSSPSEIYIQEDDNYLNVNPEATNLNQDCDILNSILQRSQTSLNNLCFPQQQQQIQPGVMGVNLNIQETTVSLDAVELKQPYLLKITISDINTELIAGEIKLDNRVIKSLNNSHIEINLSPLLSTGIHKVEISGKYRPANSTVKVELLGSQTQVSQETSGSGTINQILIINVR